MEKETKNDFNIVKWGFLFIVGFVIFWQFGLWLDKAYPRETDIKVKVTPTPQVYDAYGNPIELGGESQLTNCLLRADEVYTSNWDSTCKENGLKAGCLLQPSLADLLISSRESEKDRCVQLFKN